MVSAATLDADALGAMLDAAAGAGSSRVNLGPLLGVGDLHVGVADLSRVLSGGAPTFTLSHEGDTLTVTPSDGGATVSLDVAEVES